MKRKTKDKIASYFWIGLVIIAIFLGLYTAGVFSDEPQFTITKEVCEEEHVFNEELGDYRYRLTIESFNVKDRFEFFGCDILMRGGKLNSSEICILLEREYSRLDKEISSIDAYTKERVCHEENVITPEENKNYLTYNCDSYGGCNVIFTKDLTAEWLDENVECVKYIYSKCEESCYRDYNTAEELNVCIVERDCPRVPYPEECSKWKLGNYTISLN